MGIIECGRGGRRAPFWYCAFVRCAAFLLLAFSLGGCQKLGKNTAEAYAQLEAGEAALALEAAEAGLAAGEGRRMLLRAKGLSLLASGSVEEAIAVLEEAISLGSGWVGVADIDLAYYLAGAYGRGGRTQEALDAYLAILALRPGEREARFQSGMCRLALGQSEEALADFAQVWEESPGDYDRLITMYEALSYYGLGDAGKQMLSSALEQEAAKMDALQRGRIFYYLGEYEQAYMTLEKVRSGADAPVFLYLGMAYAAAGDYNYAVSVYSSYLERGQDAAIYNQLGLCEMKRGNYQLALEAFEAGLVLGDGDLARALSSNRISALEFLGEFAQARSAMEAHLAQYGEDARTAREYAFLQTR